MQTYMFEFKSTIEVAVYLWDSSLGRSLLAICPMQDQHLRHLYVTFIKFTSHIL